MIVTEQFVPMGTCRKPGRREADRNQRRRLYGREFGPSSGKSQCIYKYYRDAFDLLIPAALCFTFGRSIKNKKQGIAIFAAMFICLVAALAVIGRSEQMAVPQLAQDGMVDISEVSQAGGNMEGKETRFGIQTSATWAAFTTAASNGSVNSMHDSYTPIGGMAEDAFNAARRSYFRRRGLRPVRNAGLCHSDRFIAGLMVGRSAEFLGKKIEPFEMKWAGRRLSATPVAT